MSAADQIRAAALQYVQNDQGVRVEDYLAVLASLTGEAAMVTGLGFDIEGTDLVPGSAVFGEAINDRLEEAVRVMRAVLPDGAIGDLTPYFEHVARTVATAEWGHVALSVPEDHHPRVMPLRAAYELRDTVAAVAPADPHLPCAHALAEAIDETSQAIDPALAVRLSLEVAFGVAKLVPMSRRALENA